MKIASATLAVGNTAPSQTNVMDSNPSNAINLESHQPSAHDHLIGSYLPIIQNQPKIFIEPKIPLTYGKRMGSNELGESFGYNLIRGEWSIKLIQKFQDREWTKVSEKGKHITVAEGLRNIITS